MNLANIALRNLSRQKRRSFLLAGAIAIGIFIVTLINGISAGTVFVLKENMANMLGGQVFIAIQHKEGDKTISVINDDTKLVQALHELKISDADMSKTIDIQFPTGVLMFNGKEALHTVVGVEWNSSSSIQNKLNIGAADFAKVIDEPNGIIISKKTADKLKAGLGDTIILKCSTVTKQRNVGEFKIAYITADTSEFSSTVAFADKRIINQLVNLPSEKSYLTLRVHLPSVDMAPDFALKLEKVLARDYAVAPKDTTVMSMDANVFKMGQGSDFQGERVQVTTINDFLTGFGITQMAAGLSMVSLIMLAVLLVITMMGIANTFRMILYERIQEIGTMRALGMHRSEVRGLMLYEAAFLALFGVAIGVVLAGIGMVLFGLFNFGTDSMAAIILNNGHLSFLFDPASMIISTILVVGFTLLAALGPSGKAAKLVPADALRTTN